MTNTEIFTSYFRRFRAGTSLKLNTPIIKKDAKTSDEQQELLTGIKDTNFNEFTNQAPHLQPNHPNIPKITERRDKKQFTIQGGNIPAKVSSSQGNSARDRASDKINCVNQGGDNIYATVNTGVSGITTDSVRVRPAGYKKCARPVSAPPHPGDQSSPNLQASCFIVIMAKLWFCFY